jgi:hypothetical protein
MIASTRRFYPGRIQHPNAFPARFVGMASSDHPDVSFTGRDPCSELSRAGYGSRMDLRAAMFGSMLFWGCEFV